MPLCEYCGAFPVKLAKNHTCSIECGAALRWWRVKQSGRDELRVKAEIAAKKTQMAQRLQSEIGHALIQLIGNRPYLTRTEARKLYVRARNIGYLRGYSTGSKARRRRE